ncbi:MAG TPA: hypothetical protein VNI20_09505 [Fimbriimonadaceae bacterium]|nr:hypothetical protein [Fimbriimonadaceae bacterium]
MSDFGQYDVDAPEGASGSTSSQYFSRKDAKYIAFILIGMFIMGVPLYKGCKDQSEKQTCETNMRGIWSAMIQYAALNGDRLPPLYDIGANGEPQLHDGKPYVWASMISMYTNGRVNFYCPSAHEDEIMPAIGTKPGGSKGLKLTYGMYVGMSASPYLLLDQPDNTALLLETSNDGSMGSYDPLPFLDGSGRKVPYDAFMAGYDDSNGPLTPDSNWITRLAFRNSSKGYNKDSKARHVQGINVIYVSGRLGKLKPPEAEIKNVYPDVDGIWRLR